MNIQFIPSKQNILADILSRKYNLRNSTVIPNKEFVFSLKEQAVLCKLWYVIKQADVEQQPKCRCYRAPLLGFHFNPMLQIPIA